jgi:hypothetical protein
MSTPTTGRSIPGVVAKARVVLVEATHPHGEDFGGGYAEAWA